VPHPELPACSHLADASTIARDLSERWVSYWLCLSTCHRGNVDLIASDTAALLLERNTHLRTHESTFNGVARVPSPRTSTCVARLHASHAALIAHYKCYTSSLSLTCPPAAAASSTPERNMHTCPISKTPRAQTTHIKSLLAQQKVRLPQHSQCANLVPFRALLPVSERASEIRTEMRF